MPAAAPAPERNEDLSDADYQRLAAFRHALRRFARFSADAACAAGLTPSQHQVLLAIKAGASRGHLSVGRLADHLLVAPHSAAEMASRLEEEGMLVKVTDPTDRRRVGLELTASAETALRKLTTIHLREVRVMAPDLIKTLGGLLSGVPSQSSDSTPHGGGGRS